MTPPPPPIIHYVLETQFSGIDIRVLVNGMELAHGTPAEPKIIQEKINGWLIAGENKIQVYAAIPDPQHSVAPVNAKCLLFRGPMGQQPDEKDALLRFAQDDKAKFPAGAMQLVWEKTFHPEPFYGPWAWETAQPIAPGPLPVEAVLAVLRGVLVPLNAHNGVEVTKLFHVYVDELSRAYGQSAERLNSQLVSWAQSWPPLPARPLVPADYNVVVEDNRRLLRVERKDGLALFTVDPRSPGAGPKRLYLANTAMGWTIVR